MPRLWLSLHSSCQRLVALLMLLALAAAHAADPSSFVNGAALRGPQVMMYFQLPLGRGTQAIALYGLRLEQSRLQSGPLPSSQVALPYHQQLLDLQLRPHADMQLLVGRRVSWDWGRESFGAPAKPATFLLRWPLEAPRASETHPQALISGWPQTPKTGTIP